mmetsp:Transcript_48330/g.154752  ORF Transcript_48330/g.154752 Transcript_48330/m.154752 type:complete len:213 (-) Transcript_48330:348-986(-)
MKRSAAPSMLAAKRGNLGKPFVRPLQTSRPDAASNAVPLSATATASASGQRAAGAPAPSVAPGMKPRQRGFMAPTKPGLFNNSLRAPQGKQAIPSSQSIIKAEAGPEEDDVYYTVLYTKRSNKKKVNKVYQVRAAASWGPCCPLCSARRPAQHARAPPRAGGRRGQLGACGGGKLGGAGGALGACAAPWECVGLGVTATTPCRPCRRTEFSR